MKVIIILSLALVSSVGWAKCTNISDAKLNQDQIIVKNLLQSAYLYQTEGKESKVLSEFTESLKLDFTRAADHLSDSEVSSFIIQQDLGNNICSDDTYTSSKNLVEAISDQIIDTYYGCGCEH